MSLDTHRKHTDEKDLTYITMAMTNCGDRHHHLSICIYFSVPYLTSLGQRALCTEAG